MLNRDNRRRVWAGGLAISVVAVGLLSILPGAASAGPEAPGFTAAADVGSAWTDLVSANKYALPARVSLPDAPPSVLETPGSFVEDGALEVVAVYFYVCAWEDTLADALQAGDVSTVGTAQGRLGEIAALPGAKEHFNDLAAWTTEIQGRLNDAKALKADVSICTYYLEGATK